MSPADLINMGSALAGNPALTGTLVNVSDEKRTQSPRPWHFPLHDVDHGKDPTWDRLGEDWRAIDHVIEGTRIYARWTHNDDGRSYLSGLHLSDVPITADLLRSIPIGRLENMGVEVDDSHRRILADMAPLRRDKGEDPDVFAGRVAMYYRMYAMASYKPAKMIAEASGVPLATVHGWIREARLRGKLPPGKRGKAG